VFYQSFALFGRRTVCFHVGGAGAFCRRGEVGPALVVTGSYTYAPSKTVGTAPFLLGGKTVGAAASDGTIRFWDAQSGKEVHRIETGAPYFNAPLVCGRTLYAADFAGYVRAIKLPPKI
jgi:WD40 repeat protein